MIKDSILAALDMAQDRREARRRFLKVAAGSTAAVGGLALLSACGDDDNDPTPTPSPTPTPTPTNGVSTDMAVLQLALNLEYLEAQYYSIAALGVRLPESSLTGAVGERGDVTGGRQVTFQDDAIRAYAREIANDEIAHVNAIRAVLGNTATIAQPAIDISGGTSGPFFEAAKAAGVLINGAFDPYAGDDAFLLGAFLFEDVGVTAYKGAAPLLTNKVYLEAAAGILAAEAYHAGLVRTSIYARGNATFIAATNKISDARDSLDNLANRTGDDDQGLLNADGSVNLVPTDANGLAYSRNSEQVHNIVYLRTTAGIGGGFFPKGTNNSVAALRTSGAVVSAT